MKETKCPTCGSICKIGGEAETNFFIPVETNEKALKIFNTITSNGMREMTVDRFIQAINEFPSQQSKEKDEEIKRLREVLKFVDNILSKVGELQDAIDNKLVKYSTEESEYHKHWMIGISDTCKHIQSELKNQALNQ